MAQSRIRKEVPATPTHALDPFRDFEGSSAELWIARFAYGIRNNLLKVLGILGLIALVLAIVIGFTVWSDYRYEKSLEDFEALLENPILIPGAGDASVAGEKLDEYIASHGGRESVIRSELKKIELYRFADKPLEAGQSAKVIASKLNDPDLKSFFLVMAGTYLETAGNEKEALESFEKASSQLSEPSFLKALALYGVGRLQILSGDLKAGKESFRDLMEMDGENLERLKLEAAAFLATAG